MTERRDRQSSVELREEAFEHVEQAVYTLQDGL
jgi:hypothetical protein